MPGKENELGRIEHLWILGIAVAAIAGSFVLHHADGAGHLALPVPFVDGGITLPDTCASKTLLGIPCPGCGLTRSFVSMAHGDPGAAFRWNPMGPVLFFLLVGQIPYRIAEYFRLGRSVPWWMWIRDRLEFVTYAVVAGLIAAWIIRWALIFGRPMPAWPLP